MVHLVYSNRTEKLLARFVEDARAWRARGASPFDPLPLVTPNKAVDTWIRFGLARTTGFAGNIESQTLRRFIYGLLPEDRSVRIIDVKAFEGLLLSLLLNADTLRHPELAPVRDYLFAAGNDEALVDLRRQQLAAQLAKLFDEYSVSRAELLNAWREGVVYNDPTERWQRALWLRVLDLAKKREEQSKVRWLTAPELVEWLEAGNGRIPERVHLFWVSNVARFFERVLRTLAARSELYIYAVNPCRAFWDDADSSAATQLTPQGLELVKEDENPVLQLWGRAGRENVRVLNALSDWDFIDAFEEEPAESPRLLEAVRADMLDRKSAALIAEERQGTGADESIRILACPTVRREAETIATEIWSLIRADETRAREEGREPLRFNDIAVLVNPRDAGEYFTHLSAAFTEAHELPHCIVDEPFVSSSPAAEAVSLLLELPRSRFTRADLLRLATHPLVMARFPDAEAENWIDWCDRLGIVHGADRRDHAATYIEQDILNWDQGLRRLALGAFLPGDRSGVDELLSLPGGRYLPEELSQSSQTSAAQFALVVRSLMSDARFAREATLLPQEWFAFFQRLITTYVQTPATDDERDLNRCLIALQDAFTLELDGQAIGFTIAHSLAAGALKGLSGTRGSLLARGVVISTAAAVRGVPFKAIFWAGLGEGRFPASDRLDQLDLRRLQRVRSDISLRESDKYLFLETLLAARERLFLSYVARDALTGEALEPSTVVAELQSLLAQGYVGREGVKQLVEKLPLNRFDSMDAAPRLEIPEALGESRALTLREEWRRSFGETDRVPRGAELFERVANDRRQPLFETLRLALPTASTNAKDDRPVRLSLSALRRFLECPLQGHAQTVLGMGEVEEDDLFAPEDEPFETERMRTTTLLTEVCLRVSSTASSAELRQELARAYDAEVERNVLAGRMPSGVFSQVERGRHLAQLFACAQALRSELAGGGPLEYRVLRFGQAEEHAKVDQLLPPIELEVDVQTRDGVRKQKVQLHGRTDPVLANRPGSLILDWRAPKKDWSEEIRRSRKHLRAFLDHVVLTASGVAPEDEYRSCLVIAGEGVTSAVKPLPRLGRLPATEYLRTVVSDLLSQVHAYLLPCEAVFKASVVEQDHDFARAVDAVFSGRTITPSSAYGPVPNPAEYPSLPNHEAARIVARRFGLFLAAVAPPEA